MKIFIIGVLTIILSGCVTAKKLPVFTPAAPTSALKAPPVVYLLDKHDNQICSGTVVSEHYVLTAAHCLESTAKVAAIDNSNITVKITNFTEYARMDIGVLVGDFTAFNALEIETVPLEILSAITAAPLVGCGAPLGGSYICQPFENSRRMYFQVESSAFVYPGMSGGVVLNMSNNTVVGVITAASTQGVVWTPTIELLHSLSIPTK